MAVPGVSTWLVLIYRIIGTIAEVLEKEGIIRGQTQRNLKYFRVYRV